MILKWIMQTLVRLWKRRAVYYIGGSEVLPPPLSPEEEQAAVEACQAGDEQARNKLIEHNLRLVVFLARKFESAAVSTEDLISIGTIGLIKAVGTYRSDKNVKLATYASRCIETVSYTHLDVYKRQMYACTLRTIPASSAANASSAPPSSRMLSNPRAPSCRIRSFRSTLPFWALHSNRCAPAFLSAVARSFHSVTAMTVSISCAVRTSWESSGVRA